MSCLPSSYFTGTSASLVRTLIIMQREVAAAESWTPPPSWRVTENGTVTGGEGVSDSKSCARVGIWHCASISWTGTHHPTSHEATLSRQLSESLSERKLAMRGRSSTRSGSSIIAELLHLMVLTAAKWRVEPVVGTFGNWAWTDILLTNGHCD